MEKKQILILLVLFTVVAGLTISHASAATKTTGKMYFGKNFINKPIGKGDHLGIYYSGNKDAQYTKNTMHITLWSGDYDPRYHKLVKASVKFSKKIKGKTYYSTKTFKPNKWGDIVYNPKNGYKPYYAIVTYKDIKKN